MALFVFSLLLLILLRRSEAGLGHALSQLRSLAYSHSKATQQPLNAMHGVSVPRQRSTRRAYHIFGNMDG